MQLITINYLSSVINHYSKIFNNLTALNVTTNGDEHWVQTTPKLLAIFNFIFCPSYVNFVTVAAISTINSPSALAYLFTMSWQTAPLWQGTLAHSSTSTSHSMPSNPGEHSQEYMPIRSWQVAPLRQGLDSHSSISLSQFTPGGGAES